MSMGLTDLEQIYSVALVGLAGVVAAPYLLRGILKGCAHFARVKKQVGSALLSKEMMEAFYWFLQPLWKFLVYCRVTPNGVSWASLGFGVLAGACLAVGHFGSGAAFATVSAVMDS